MGSFLVSSTQSVAKISHLNLVIRQRHVRDEPGKPGKSREWRFSRGCCGRWGHRWWSKVEKDQGTGGAWWQNCAVPWSRNFPVMLEELCVYWTFFSHTPGLSKNFAWNFLPGHFANRRYEAVRADSSAADFRAAQRRADEDAGRLQRPIQRAHRGGSLFGRGMGCRLDVWMQHDKSRFSADQRRAAPLQVAVHLLQVEILRANQRH